MTWQGFSKYVGVQGVIATLLVGGFVYASVSGIELGNVYENILITVVSFVFGKNGASYATAIAGKIKSK